MNSKQIKLDALRKKMLKANLPLKETANSLVFGEFNPEASVVFVGEAPGKNEDLKGRPFIGSAGKVLDQLLHSIKLDRADIYITSILKYRPPNNRNPNIDEITRHTPYLIDQIRIIQPKVLVPLGNFAARFVLSGFDVQKMGEVEPISKLHGKPKKVVFEGFNFSVIALYHPAAVLYNPPLRKTLEEDFKVVRKFL
jgi:DNA polymerase